MSDIREFRGIYVSNFEIGYFFECEVATGGCDNWVRLEPRWLRVSDGESGQDLSACMTRWNGSRDRWALYAITFRGRQTLERRSRQHMHDTENYVVLDQLEALEMVGTDQTIEWAMPRYRRQPALRC